MQGWSGRRSSGDGRAPVHCGEFLGYEESEKTQGMEKQKNTPNWPEAQMQRLMMAQTGGESVCWTGGSGDV